MAASGRSERLERVSTRKSGSWASISQDILMVSARLFRLSREEASSRPDKNSSKFIYGGVPLLLAATQSFVIEYEGIMNLEALPKTLSSDSLARLFEERYGLSGDLFEDLRDLIEIRNEIIHPVPLPVGAPDNWPDYLRRVKERGLLFSTGDRECDYVMLHQIASHRLFEWAVDVTRRLYQVIVSSNPGKAGFFQPFADQFKTMFGPISAKP